MQTKHVPTYSGVYVITNVLTGEQYVGASINIRRRIYGHKQALIEKRNACPQLLQAWHQYGAEAFEARALEETDNLAEREAYWIDKLQPIYNTLRNGSWTGHRHTEIAKQRQREAKLGKKQSPQMIAARVAGMRGHIVTDETRRRISAAKIAGNKARKEKAT